MRISDWSSDVCSSDLHCATVPGQAADAFGQLHREQRTAAELEEIVVAAGTIDVQQFGERLAKRLLELVDCRLVRHREFGPARSEEHTSELQSLMRISYAVFCLKKKNNRHLSRTRTAHK